MLPPIQMIFVGNGLLSAQWAFELNIETISLPEMTFIHEKILIKMKIKL